MAEAAKKGLGKGLSALMGSSPMPNSQRPQPVAAKPAMAIAATDAGAGGGVRELPVATLMSGKYQPRRHFSEENLSELADSIEKHGIMQPIVVRAVADGKYEIIAGERRWRAAKLAELKTVPVIIRDVGDADALELALIENIQRADLNPLEEAEGYQRLMAEFKHTQESLSKVVGKSRSHIANLLRLLKLPDGVKKHIDAGTLSMGHARAVLMAKDPEILAKTIIAMGLSVRQAEELAQGRTNVEAIEAGIMGTAKSGEGRGANGGNTNARSSGKSNDVLQLESMLCDSLGLKVSINTRGGQVGDVVITYESLSQLDDILRRLGGGI
ncbi:MAG: ParB/RepB/Spo0J family partition protein [Rickettsiales bacterium]